ncbi:ABC transporter ATP-binding protein [Candidatus Saccharibacteria bacterium]|nr:ABC transporter ATP-binding protein [Candidatus Saccharibacteria bacterium]MBI3337681.1 ABC transporter ATP-binding protein [Candidatus Saccharibacteria bacterium]
MKNRNIIEVNKINKTYVRGKTAYKALNNMSFVIKQGELVSIMGPSGSGKTTLLNQLGALDRPESGHVIIDGVDITNVPEGRLFKVRRQKIGFVFQSFYLVSTLSALDNVLLPIMPLRRKSFYRQRAIKLLETVGLGDKLNNKPSELSGGQMQRVAIARALILDPPIILADEPTGNLDSHTGAEIFRLIKQLNQEEGKTFIIVTHDPRIAKASKRIIYLLDGTVVDNPSVKMEITF